MYNINDVRNSVINGHVLSVLKNFPDNSVDCVITSPPYYALRNYCTNPTIWDNHDDCEHEWVDIRKVSTGGKGYKQDTSKGSWFDTTVQYCSKCAAYKGELGLEPFFRDHKIEIDGKILNFKGFVSHLCDICDEVKRILKPTGTFFLNIGDTYYGGNKSEGGIEAAQQAKQGTNKGSFENIGGSFFKNKELPDKCLCMVPQRVAIELIDRGWILRNHIVWHKTNAFPSPVKDRFSADWEDVFFFVKSRKYHFEQQFEPCSFFDKNEKEWYTISEDDLSEAPMVRNKRTVWPIPIQPFSSKKVGVTFADHFAAFPTELVETPIKAGCPKKVCSECGTPMMNSEDKEQPQCECNKSFKHGIVLDIFMGTGTTAVVAHNLGVDWIGVEFNRKYCDIIRRRVEVEANQYNAKIVDIDGNKLAEERSCSTCNVQDCMIREGDDFFCDRWESK